MEYKFFNHLPEEAKIIRQNVFVEEQGFTNEFDDIDKLSIHLILYLNNLPIATARLYNSNASNEYIIGRVAVLPDYRKLGLGNKLLKLMENKALELKANKLSLSAQYNVIEFYEKENYHTVGDIFYEDNCKHIKMEKELGGYI